MAQAQLVKFYEYDYNKPELSDDTLIHFGVKGMKWGVRKDGKPQGYQGGNGRITKKSKPSEKKVSRRQQKKAAAQTRKEYNDRLKKELEKMYNDPEAFSNKQKNDIMNDINTQDRLEKMYRDHSSSSGKVKQIIKSPGFKKVAGAIAVSTLVGVAYAGYRYNQGLNAPISRIPDFENQYGKQYTKDVANGMANYIWRSNHSRIFKGMKFK